MCKCLDTALSVFEHNCKLCPKSGHRLSSVMQFVRVEDQGRPETQEEATVVCFVPEPKLQEGKQA